MKYLLISLLLLGSCGDIKKEFAPDEIEIHMTLRNSLKSLLELAIEEEVCHRIEEEGFECNIPEQLKHIEFTWVHDQYDTVKSKLTYCLKEECSEILDE